MSSGHLTSLKRVGGGGGRTRASRAAPVAAAGSGATATGGTRVTVRLGDLTRWEATVDGRAYVRLSADRAGMTNEVGAPEVPLRGVLVEVPAGRRVTGLTVDSVTFGDPEKGALIPRAAPVFRTAGNHPLHVADAGVYARSEWPASPDLVRLDQTFDRGGRSLAKVLIALVQARPADATYRPLREIAFTVNHDAAPATSRARPRGNADLAARLGDRFVGDSSPAAGSTRGTDEEARFLVLTSRQLEGVVTDLLAEKASAYGGSVRLVLAEDIAPGMGAERRDGVRAWLQEVWETWTTPPEHVLLVGWYDDFPPFYEPYLGASGEIPSDHRYSDVTDDLFPNFVISRVPYRNPEWIRAAFRAAAGFEGGEGTWTGRTLLIGHDHPIDIRALEAAEEMLAARGYQSTWLGDRDAPSDVVTELSEGRILTNYSGHGFDDLWDTTGFRVEHLEDTDSEGVPTGVISVSCLNGKIDDHDRLCLGAAMVGFGKASWFLGGTRETWYAPGEFVTLYMTEALLDGDTPGEAMLRTKSDMLLNFPGDGYTIDDVRNYHLWGVGDRPLPPVGKSEDRSNVTPGFSGMGNEWGWDDWTGNGAMWFRDGGIETDHRKYCPRSDFASVMSSGGVSFYYHLCHGGATVYMAGDEQLIYAGEVLEWTDQPAVFAFIGSCGAMKEVGEGTLSGAFVKSSRPPEGRAAVGYISDGSGNRSESRDWWTVSLEWQHLAFYLIFRQGMPVAAAFDTATLEWPAIRNHWGFFGDEELVLNPGVAADSKMEVTVDPDARSFRKPSKASPGAAPRADAGTLASAHLSSALGAHAAELRLENEDYDRRNPRHVYHYERWVDDVHVARNHVVVEVDPSDGEIVGFANHFDPSVRPAADWRLNASEATSRVQDGMAEITAEMRAIDHTRANFTFMTAVKECRPLDTGVSALDVDTPFPTPRDWRTGWRVTVEARVTRQGQAFLSAFDVLVDPGDGSILLVTPPSPLRPVD